MVSLLLILNMFHTLLEYLFANLEPVVVCLEGNRKKRNKLHFWKKYLKFLNLETL